MRRRTINLLGIFPESRPHWSLY